MQNRPGEEFLAAAQVCCVLLSKNMLYTNNNRSSSTIPPYWLIKSFHSTVRMYFCPQKWHLKCYPLGRKMSIVHASATAADTFIPC